jgi:hypothetical protein
MYSIPQNENNEITDSTESTYEEPIILNDTWVIWIYFHDPIFKNSKNSFKNIISQNQSVDTWKSNIKQVYEFNTIQGFWKYFNNLKYLTDPTIFLMRKGINPVWEDPQNKNGGNWSFIVSKKIGIETWTELSCMTVGESLLNTKLQNHKDNLGNYLINGISIAIKLKSFVLKIWNSDKNLNNQSLLNNISGIDEKNISYKSYFTDNFNKPIEKINVDLFKGSWD